MIILWGLATIIAVSCTSTLRHPIIIVPGNGGSRIEAKLNKPKVVHLYCKKTTDKYKTLWLDPKNLLPFFIQCFADNMKLVYDEAKHITQNSPGVDTRIVGWGDTSSIENLDPEKFSFFGKYFSTICDKLVEAGFQRSISLRGAPYDFRKAANEQTEFFCNLKILTEETYQNNNNTPVVFIAHSMGGCMVRQFLEYQNQKWKDTYVRAMVTLAAPWGGSVRALKLFLEGDNLDIFIINEDYLKPLQITWSSVAWLLPSTNFWKPDEILIETDKKNYTSKDYKTIFEDISYETGYKMYVDNLPYTKNGPPGVEAHCLYGNNIDTVEKFVYKPGDFPSEDPEIQSSKFGDGTINLRSLTGYNQWSTMQKEKVFYEVFDDVDHMGIIEDSRAIDYILKLVVVPSNV